MRYTDRGDHICLMNYELCESHESYRMHEHESVDCMSRLVDELIRKINTVPIEMMCVYESYDLTRRPKKLI